MSQSSPRPLENLSGAGRRFAVVAARFNDRFVEPLVAGAVACLTHHGVAPEAVTVVRVPGAFEIPLALEELAHRAHGGGCHGLVALGVVIRGGTPHFDYVCDACTRGVASVAERHRLPVGFGVLTCDTEAQAEERSGGPGGDVRENNKGWDAALAALEMVDLLARLRSE